MNYATSILFMQFFLFLICIYRFGSIHKFCCSSPYLLCNPAAFVFFVIFTIFASAVLFSFSIPSLTIALFSQYVNLFQLFSVWIL